EQVHPPRVDDVHALCRLAVLHEDRRSLRSLDQLGRLGGGLSLLLRDGGERRLGRQGVRVLVGGVQGPDPKAAGLFGPLRTLYGSWDQIMLPTTRPLGSSAAITIAPARTSPASSTIFFAALRVPITWPSASRPQPLSARTASSDFLRCSSHSRLLGISPGF